MDVSKNNRHDTVSDVRVFLEREAPDRARTVEVVCSSARRDMDRQSTHVPYRLFCETVALFPECASTDTGSQVATGWPTTTTICCWHDCHPFDTTPIPIPKSKHGLTYTVYGVVCSGNCGLAYILEKNTYDQQLQLMLFKSMLHDVFGLNSEDVFALEAAPPRIFLNMFGGHLDIASFRARSLAARSTLLTPPFISYSMVLEENARSRDAQQPESMRVDGCIAPISSHVIRGLRRPTRVLDDDDSMAQPRAAEEAKPSLFEMFVKNKVSAATDGGGVAESKAEGMQVEDVKPAKGKGKAAPRGRRAAAPSTTAGTLAAYLHST